MNAKTQFAVEKIISKSTSELNFRIFANLHKVMKIFACIALSTFKPPETYGSNSKCWVNVHENLSRLRRREWIGEKCRTDGANKKDHQHMTHEKFV